MENGNINGSYSESTLVELVSLPMNCLHKLVDEKEFYCLKYQDFLEICPLKCPYHFEHQSWNLRKFGEKFDISCRNLLVTKDQSEEEPTIFCLEKLTDDFTCINCEQRNQKSNVLEEQIKKE